MGVPQPIGELLANLKAEIKHATAEDHTPLIVAARHCAETCRRYIAVSGDLSVTIDNVVSKCSILVEAIKQGQGENVRGLRHEALYAVDDLSRVVEEAELKEEATILRLPRK